MVIWGLFIIVIHSYLFYLYLAIIYDKMIQNVGIYLIYSNRYLNYYIVIVYVYVYTTLQLLLHHSMIVL